MKLSELIRELTDLQAEDDTDPEVHFTYNYGDHWRTEVAPKITGIADGKVKHSAYHNMPKVVDEDDKEYDRATVAILLS